MGKITSSIFILCFGLQFFNSSAHANREDYERVWKSIPQKLLHQVFDYYKSVDLGFLEDKVRKELVRGNAGGPQVRSRYPNSTSTEKLASASVQGLRYLLAVKTIEDLFPFREKSKLSEDSMLTGLAWHSLMLQPRKYILITNSVFKLSRESDFGKKEIPDDRFKNLVKSVNLDLLGILGKQTDGAEIEDERHALNVDVREVLKEKFPGFEIEAPEWNMPLPLFPDHSKKM